DPPLVPTPGRPASVPKLLPFSIEAAYPARASRSGSCEDHACVAGRSLRSASAIAAPVIIAEELDIPEAGGRSEETVSRADRSGPKLSVRRARTVWTYRPQCPAGSAGGAPASRWSAPGNASVEASRVPGGPSAASARTV